MSIDLEEFCVIQPYESAWRPPYDGKFHEIRPGISRKVYPPSKKDRRIYMGAVLEPRDQLRPVKEIAKHEDKRGLVQLSSQAKDALGQMLCRAHCGDKAAMLEYILSTRAAVDSLQRLASHQPLKVTHYATTFPIGLCS